MADIPSNEQQCPRHKTIITNVHIWTGTNFTDPQSLAIEDDKITFDLSNPNNTIDGQNSFLLPGFINSHVHVLKETHLHLLLQHGVTTSFDMAMYPSTLIPKLTSLPNLPTLKTAGIPLSAPGSVHSCVLPLPPTSFLSSPDQAGKWVEDRIAEGSEYIKIISDFPIGPDQEIMNAVTNEARKRGKIVVAHAASYKPWKMAIEAGVDVVTHLPLDKPLDKEMLAGRKIVAVPTMCMMRETSKRPPISAVANLVFKNPKVIKALVQNSRKGEGKGRYENAVESLRVLREEGVRILVGTDCHQEENSVFDVPHGESFHRELELLVEAGMSETEVLRAATSLPAEVFGLGDRGRIEEGMRADLVLLKSNPVEDIRNSRGIERVWLGAVEVGRVTRDG